MEELISNLWRAEVRAGPVIVGVLSFAVINGLRRWFRIQYIPSYFAVFPISLLDADVARFAGPLPHSVTEENRSRVKREFIIKVSLASFLTFVLIPLLLGFAAALYMTVSEFAVMVTILLTWQSYAAYQSTSDNTRYSQRPVASASFFATFYLFYLASLGGFMHRGFVFTRPFIVSNDWAGLATAAWDVVFVVIVAGIVMAVFGNVVSHLVIDRDVI